MASNDNIDLTIRAKLDDKASKDLKTLSGSIDKIKGEVTTTAKADTGAAENKVKTYKDKLDSIQKSVSTKVVANTKSAHASIENLKRKLDAFDKKNYDVKVSVKADGDIKAISSLSRALQTLEKRTKDFSINVGMGSTEKVTKNLENVADRIKAIDKNAHISFSSEGFNGLSSELKEIYGLLKGINKYKDVNVSGRANISRQRDTSTKNNGRKVNNDSKQFNDLRKQLASTITEINKFDTIADNGNKSLNAKVQEALGIMDNMKQFLTERGKLSYAAESKLYGNFLPSIKNEYARREWLKRQRVAAVNNNYANLGSGLRSNVEGRYEPTISSLKNILTTRLSGIELAKLAGSFERGFGSGMHELARQAEMTEKSILGINRGLVAIPESISTGVAAFAGFSVAIGATVSVIETLFSVVQSIGSAIADYIIKPGLEAANAMQMMRNGIAGAMSSIGLLNNQPLQFSEALNMADGIVKQLAVDAIKTGTSLEAITNTFRAIIEPGLQSGMNISQIEEMANLFTTIGKELQLNSLTIARDTRDIFNGMANRTVMAKQLGITDQEIQEVKAKGEDLYAWLENRLAGFVASNRENIATLGGAFDSLKSTWELTLASVFDNDTVKQPIIEFMKWVGSQIATVYDMGINPNSAKWDALKKSSAARNGIDTSDQAAVDQNAEDTGLQDDATKYRDATGATEEETQALEEQNATVIILNESFEKLLEFVTNFVDIIGEAAIEIAEYAEQSLGAEDSVNSLSDAIAICVDLFVFIAERIIDVIALVEENRTSIEDLGYGALYAFAILKNVFLGIVSFIKPVIASFRALYNAAKAAWDMMHGDTDGAKAAAEQALVNAEEAAKGALKKYMPIVGEIATGVDIAVNTYRDIQTINGWRQRSQQAREAGENSQPYKNLHGFTDGIRNFLNNRNHVLSTQNPNQNALKGRPADNNKEKAKAQREADRSRREAIRESQRMLKERQQALKEILEDKLDRLKDLLNQNEIAYKEGFTTVTTYFENKAKLEAEEAQARLEEAQQEREAIANSKFDSEYQQLEALHKVDREIRKYTKQLEVATLTQKEVASVTSQFVDAMTTANISNQFGGMDKNGNTNAPQIANGVKEYKTGDKTMDAAIATAVNIYNDTGKIVNPGLIKGLIDVETSHGESDVFKLDNNLGGVTWNSSMGESKRGNARPVNEGGYYVHFNNLSEATKGLAEVLELSRYKGLENTNDPAVFTSILKSGGYMTTDDLSGYISSMTEGTQKFANLNMSLVDIIKSMNNMSATVNGVSGTLGGTITQMLNQAENQGKLLNAEMPHLRKGCVEAVVRLGSWFSPALKNEFDKGVAYIPTLIEDLQNAGIKYDTDNLSVTQPGDVLVVNGGNHVVMVKDAEHTVGNSSYNNPNTSSGSGIMEQDMSYWLPRTVGILRTGSMGLGDIATSPFALDSPHKTSGGHSAYDKAKEVYKSYLKILNDVNSDIFGRKPDMRVVEEGLNDEIEKARNAIKGDPKMSNIVKLQLDNLLKRVRQTTARKITEFYMNMLETNLDRVQETGQEIANKFATGNIDTNQIKDFYKRYFGYFFGDGQNIDAMKKRLAELKSKQAEYEKKYMNGYFGVDANDEKGLKDAGKPTRAQYLKAKEHQYSTFNEQLYKVNNNKDATEEEIKTANLMVKTARREVQGLYKLFDKEAHPYKDEIAKLEKSIELAMQTPLNQMISLEEQFAEMQRLGNVDEAQKIRRKLESARNTLYGIYDNWIKAIESKYEFESNYFDKMPVTNLQKEQGNQLLSAYKNKELAYANQQKLDLLNNQYMYRLEKISEYENKIKDLEKTNARGLHDNKWADRNAQIARLNEKIQGLKFATGELYKQIGDTTQIIRLEKELAKIPTLLQSIGKVAKQSLEDNLVTFLTDGVNEAKSFKEAFGNMLMGILKDIQTFLAKETVRDLMTALFGHYHSEGIGNGDSKGNLYEKASAQAVKEIQTNDSHTRQQLETFANGEGILGSNLYTTYRYDVDRYKNAKAPKLQTPYFMSEQYKKSLNQPKYSFKLSDNPFTISGSTVSKTLDADTTKKVLYDTRDKSKQIEQSIDVDKLGVDTQAVLDRLNGINVTLQTIDSHITGKQISNVQEQQSVEKGTIDENKNSVSIESQDNQIQDSNAQANVQATQQVDQGVSNLSSTVSIGTQDLSTKLDGLNQKAELMNQSLEEIKLAASDSGAVEKATGGIINGIGTSTSDSIPAMLSNGEYVVKASSVRKYGTNFLNAVNDGSFSRIPNLINVPKFADGGEVAAQETARGMSTFASTLGTNVSSTTNMNVALVSNQEEAIAHFMRSPRGQRIMLDFTRGSAKFTNKIVGSY